MSKTFDRYASIAFLLIGLLFVIESQKSLIVHTVHQLDRKYFRYGLGIILILLSLAITLRNI